MNKFISEQADLLNQFEQLDCKLLLENPDDFQQSQLNSVIVGLKLSIARSFKMINVILG